MKLIICFSGKTAYRGHKAREFLFLPKYELFVWGGRELTVEEFNAAAQKVFERNQDLRPYVKVVSVEDAAAGDSSLSKENEALKARIAELQAQLNSALQAPQPAAPESAPRKPRAAKPAAPDTAS